MRACHIAICATRVPPFFHCKNRRNRAAACRKLLTFWRHSVYIAVIGMIDFFQTLNISRFVFSDGDNVNNPTLFVDFLQKKGYLNLETQIVCFLGANSNQNTWYNTATKYIQSLGKNSASINITPIRIRMEASNALDMVLTAYVGLSMARNPASEFVIVSADKDYDAMVQHFSSIGIAIRRESVMDKENADDGEEKAAQKAADETKRRLDKDIADIILKLEGRDKTKLPRKLPALKNYLFASFKEIVSKHSVDSLAEALLAELKEKGKIEKSEEKITWT